MKFISIFALVSLAMAETKYDAAVKEEEHWKEEKHHDFHE